MNSKYVLQSSVTKMMVAVSPNEEWVWVNDQAVAAKFDTMTEAILFASAHDINNYKAIPVEPDEPNAAATAGT